MLERLHEILAKVAELSREIGPFKTAIGSIVAAIGAIWASKKWFWEKYDGKILRMLQESRRTAQVNMRPGQHLVFFPFVFEEIVKEANRSKKSVSCSLRRLENCGLVHEVRDGWNLGPRPEVQTLERLASASRWNATSRWAQRW